ncbi:hypothetical protein ACIB24_16205 [Spongisporangium articulatum]|uniref:DUF4190 domain-containing protein n=1 Tax=Spongisporangium articulatum TaxID=3362603 RepID=A0ABW8AQG0_9ACTN
MSTETQLSARPATWKKARNYKIAAVVATVVTALFLMVQVLAVPLTGGIGVLLAWLAARNGADRTQMLVLGLVCGIPALFMLIILALIVPALPHLTFNGVSLA